MADRDAEPREDDGAADSRATVLDEAQRAELRRRVARLDAHPGSVAAWEVVEAEARTWLRRRHEG